MSVVVQYTVATSFNYGGVNVLRLQQEIQASAVVSTVVSVTSDSVTCFIEFVSPLSSTDQTNLDAVVAAHVPTPVPDVTPAYLTDVNVVMDTDGRIVYQGDGLVLTF